MGKHFIKYSSLTAEELEERVEFVVWSKVPSHLITNKIFGSFGFMHKLQGRVWLENILSRMIIKEDQEIYPDKFFFFIGEVWYMTLDGDYLFCSYNIIWSILNFEFNIEVSKVEIFIRNVVKIHFKKIKFNQIKINPILEFDNSDIRQLERHFKDKEVWK